MNDTRMTVLTLSTRNVSADGTAVCPGDDAGPCELEVGRVLAALRAFAGLPAMDLVDTEARIFLTGPKGKVAVQNIGGRLFVATLPEAVQAAAEQTPEQTIALVTTGVAAPASLSAAGPVAEPDWAVVRPRKRGWLDSGAVLAGLVLIAAATAWWTFRPVTPDGLEMISDGAEISALHTRLDGRYGTPPATVLVLAGGTLSGVQPGATGGEETKFRFGYRLARRGNQVVLVVANGALLDVEPNGALKFLESVYPRAAK